MYPRHVKLDGRFMFSSGLNNTGPTFCFQSVVAFYSPGEFKFHAL